MAEAVSSKATGSDAAAAGEVETDGGSAVPAATGPAGAAAVAADLVGSTSRSQSGGRADLASTQAYRQRRRRHSRITVAHSGERVARRHLQFTVSAARYPAPRRGG
ncbi:hypothetical protein Vretimale_18308 [Volvox reticuliferus]|uniref:Uncharacterized protein n=1 Tax=Volvox reticuliferus TaxID=1737510 RepID=A0A8J4GUM8_9CHLO|nr:hypothetical protein Vretimale_18308 [Volvox reticuliferus]